MSACFAAPHEVHAGPAKKTQHSATYHAGPETKKRGVVEAPYMHITARNVMQGLAQFFNMHLDELDNWFNAP